MKKRKNKKKKNEENAKLKNLVIPEGEEQILEIKKKKINIIILYKCMKKKI